MKARLPAVFIAAGLIAAPVHAQPASQGPTTQNYEAPRTSWGAPDLQGYWTNTSLTGMERPARASGVTVSQREADLLARQHGMTAAGAQENSVSAVDEVSSRRMLADRNTSRGYNRFWMDPGASYAQVKGEYRTAWVVDPPSGLIPYREAQQPRPQNVDGPEVRPQSERCLMSFTRSAGPVLSNGLYNNTYQIVQTPDTVMILTEMIHDVRIIPIGKTHGPAVIPKWGGDSVGRYEDDTLVVETVNPHPGQRSYISATGKLTERFSRWSDGQVLYQFTVEDPALYTRTWSGEMVLNTSPHPPYEYACHEGNYALPAILAGARQLEREGRPRQAIKPYIGSIDVSEGQ
ncbi:MAG TPA: hypothetical protein PLN33_08580 [Hyphomonadaceae bacterium]|nr:hypothetical protein [Hyphomonadaceae bacterium]HPN05900.1 hypothetical protein [Hyphomonadaceae bacterium]